MKDKTVGFIGLGIMGKPMSLNLLKAGYTIKAFDINAVPLAEVVGKGAEKCSSSKEVAEASEIIITMLPNSPEVREVILGKDGVLEGLKKGTIVIDMSSIAPLVSIEMEKKIAEKGAYMLDAPVSGGEPKAVDGTLAIMVGGEENIFSQVEEMLLVMGASAVLVGDIGSGNTCKLANQIIVALNIAAMSEAMTFVQKAGVKPENVFNAIKNGLAGSTVLNAKMPLTLDGNFKPGFRIDLHIKDLNNVVETSHNVGSFIPLSTQVLEMFYRLREDGKGSDDHGGLIQYYEKVLGLEVRK